MKPVLPGPAAQPLGHGDGPAGRWARHGQWARYGALGAPLAFAALPLYVLLPNHYAATLGAPLAGLGAVLLATRLADAVVDPALGRLADRLLAGSRVRAMQWALLAGLLLGGGLVALFFPPASVHSALLAWCAGALAITSLGYSGLSVLHQAWGSRLGGGAVMQARLVGWREGLALAGVLTASILPGLAGIAAMVATAALLLLAGLAALATVRWPAAPGGLRLVGQPPGASASAAASGASGFWQRAGLPWRVPAFRSLMAVFVLNGIASAVPATLVLFFVRDRLGAAAQEPLFLGLYFAAAAASMPLWVQLVARFGLVQAWLGGMALAVASFVWAARLGQGDVAAFAGVCLATGLALGADLTVPPALLTGVIRQARHQQQHEGNYFGWWTCANKLNLALAAGLALPALQWLGYRPGAQDAAALEALAVAYAALPCLLKLAAGALLWRLRHQLEPSESMV